MCQPNYSRIENCDAACAKRLPLLSEVLETTPETLQNYHLVQTSTSDLEPADWVKNLLTEKEKVIQLQKDQLHFLNLYVDYIKAVGRKFGLPFDKPDRDWSKVAVDQ